MYKAEFEMDSWLGLQTFQFTGDTLYEIVDKLNQIQDLGCLVRMGRQQGVKVDYPALNTLEEFLNKYYDGKLTIEDFKPFDIELSIGSIKCTNITEE